MARHGPCRDCKHRRDAYVVDLGSAGAGLIALSEPMSER
jgi:hypothetical protein